MNKKIHIIIWVLIILFVANLTAVITIYLEFKTVQKESQDMYDPDRQGMMQVLEFSPEQQEQMHELKMQHMQHMQAIMQQMRKGKILIVEEFKKEETNDSLIDEYAKSLGEIYYQMQLLDVEHMRDIMEICDAEQKQKAKEKVFENFFMRDMPRRGGPPNQNTRPPQGPRGPRGGGPPIH